MTIDDRLREAAHEARVATAGLEVPAASRARRAARHRGPLTALAAAAVVAALVAGVALLRDGGTPTTVAPAGPDPTPATVEETADAVPVIPAGAERVPIGGASAADAEAARRAAEDAEGLPADVIGAVGETVLLTVDRGGELCLVAVDLPQVRSACGPGGPPVEYAIRQLPDGGHRAVVSGRLPADAAIVVVTAGDTRYAQEGRDGWVFVPLAVDAAPVRIEALAADGRRVSALDPDAELVERVMQVLRLDLVARLAEVRRNPDPAEQAVLDAQLEALETPIVVEGEAESFEGLLALGEQRLEQVRREVESRPAPEPVGGPRVIPTPPEVTAALGDTLAIAAPSQPGVVWLTGTRRVVDGIELPARLYEVDAATGQIVVAHDVGPPMTYLAAGVGRVWFGRTGDAALPQSAIGYVDLARGEIAVDETDLDIADIVLADAGGGEAWVVGGEPGTPVVARVGPGAQPAPLALDFDPGLLITGLAWDGGLLVADDAGTLWRVDASTESVDRFADVGGAPFVLDAATLAGGDPALWALVRSEPGVRAVLLGPDGEPQADHSLPADTRSLVTEQGTGAFALTMSGEVWFLDASQEPTLVTTVVPGSADTGFGGMARSGTALWLRGGTSGLVWLELGR